MFVYFIHFYFYSLRHLVVPTPPAHYHFRQFSFALATFLTCLYRIFHLYLFVSSLSSSRLASSRLHLTAQVHEARAATAAAVETESELRSRVKAPLSSSSSASSSSAPSAARSDSHAGATVADATDAAAAHSASQIHLWQVVLIAILCLIIGRML